MHVLKEQVLHHHKEEEEHLFPKVEKLFDSAKLAALGDVLTGEVARLHEEHPRARVFGRTEEAARLSVPDVPPLSARQ